MNFVDECKAVDIRFIVVWTTSCLVWYGVLFIHHGIYEEGVFKFVMTIPENYPDGDCPVSTILMKNSNRRRRPQKPRL
jgi:ubiquitin-protein ligase